MAINFGLLDTQQPGRIANSFYEGQQDLKRNALAEAQLQHAMTQNQLGQYQLSSAKRADEGQNALAEVYKSALDPATGQVNRNALLQGLAQRGQGHQIPGISAKFLEEDEKRARMKATTGKALSGASSAIFDDPSDKNINMVLDMYSATTGEPVVQVKQALLSIPDAAQRKKAVLAIVGQHPEGREALQALTAKYDWKNTGQALAPVQTNPLAGPVGVAQNMPQIPVSADPNARLADERQREQGALNRAISRADVATKEEANRVAREVAGVKRTQDTEMKLADDYRNESKGFAETSTSIKKVLAALETADKNPGSALAAGTAFMKILDPASVVRESELGLALNASGWFDRATNIVQTLKSGKIMTKEQVKNLRSASQALFEEAKAAQREIDAGYAARAKEYGANPKNVIMDRGQGRRATDKEGLPSMSEIDAEIARRAGKR